MTVGCHVDNLKFPHENGYTVGALISKLRKRYGKEADLTIHQGKVHEYLGMKLDYREDRKSKIDMTDYLKKSWMTSQKNIKVEPSHRRQTICLRSMRPHTSQARSTPRRSTQASTAGHPDRGGFTHNASERDQQR